MKPPDADCLAETCDIPNTATDGQQSLGDTTAHVGGPAARETPNVAIIGKYRVIERLGAGGQGEVFRAVHPSLSRDVVVKWASKSLPDASRQQLVEEGRVLAQLEDPGLVRVYDVDVWEGRPFVVFEYLQGINLADELRRNRPAVRDALRLTANIGRIVARIHERGVLHRDLKPANILLDQQGRPRLLDFGLACMSQAWSDGESTPFYGLIGTVSYMSPEQANGDGERCGPRSDQFSLAAILYEMLTGRPPYWGTTFDSVWDQAREGLVLPLRQRNPRVPRAIERICMNALAANPASRYSSVAAFVRALDGYLARPRRFMLAGAGLLLLVTGVLVASWLNRTRPVEDLAASNNRPAVTEPAISAPVEPPPPSAPPARPKPPAGWIEFELPAGGYRVWLPGKPKEARSTVKGKSGPQEMIQVSLHDAGQGMHYAVAYAEFLGRTFSDIEKALDAGRDGALANVKGTALSEEKLHFGKHVGRDMTIGVASAPKIRIRVHFFVIGQRMYQLLVGGSEQQVKGPDAERFFASFQLLEEK